MSGRIEMSVCCVALLAGSATAVDPEAHVPVLLAEVTAVFGVEGKHNDTEDAACATAPPENRTAVAVTGSNVRRASTRRSITTHLSLRKAIGRECRRNRVRLAERIGHAFFFNSKFS
jgi:hypothetical protein